MDFTRSGGKCFSTQVSCICIGIGIRDQFIENKNYGYYSIYRFKYDQLGSDDLEEKFGVQQLDVWLRDINHTCGLFHYSLSRNSDSLLVAFGFKLKLYEIVPCRSL